MAQHPVIRVEQLHKTFRRVRLKRGYSTLKSALLNPFSGKGALSNKIEVLKGIDLLAGRGETIGLIGRNGSGKSTLLKIMAGIYQPTSGEVELTGRVSSLIELGAGFHPEFSGRENIFLNGAILGLSRDEIQSRYDRIVRFAGLEEFIDAPVRTYSSGMYIRLGFSVAVNVNPDILLIDEVLAVGDEAFSHKCEDKINEFKRSGKTIVIVSHDLSAIERFCHRAVWLEGGIVREQGEPRKVIDAYRQYVSQMEDQSMIAERDEEEPGDPERWGDGRVKLGQVAVTDPTGKPKAVFEPGEGLKIGFDYAMEEPVTDLVFGVSLAKSDGGHVFGINTDIDRIDLPELDLSGRVEFVIDRQTLVNGTYFIDAAAHAKDGRAYDYWTRAASFAVRSNIDDAGVYRPDHHWVVNGSSL